MYSLMSVRPELRLVMCVRPESVNFRTGNIGWWSNLIFLNMGGRLVDGCRQCYSACPMSE